MDIRMQRNDGHVTIAVAGDMTTTEDTDLVADVFGLVPAVEHVVLDLAGLLVLASSCVPLLRQILDDRLHDSEVVVVTGGPEITQQLVLEEIDRFVPLLRSVRDAQEVIRMRSGLRPEQVGI